MANKPPIPTINSALIAMIADEDTVVGFLLAGVGNVDLRRKTNYLIVDSSMFLNFKFTLLENSVLSDHDFSSVLESWNILYCPYLAGTS
uniref:V-type proton ATPase subunit F n=1 Tax=Rhizophora mucronata TaxID=61149 RepID=A0A2P2KHT8_RHIMU